MLALFKAINIRLVAAALVFIAFQNVSAVPLVPSISEHEAFLLGEWEDSRLNLVIFVDPRCPYCIRAIPRYKNIKDYNVFIYWAPILGQRSEAEVDKFFDCENPVSSLVMGYVAEPSGELRCASAKNPAALREINDRIVASYDISIVPSYYLQGKRVSLSEVISSNKQATIKINGVSVDWSRYQSNKVQHREQSEYQAIVLPEKIKIKHYKMLERYQPRYVFSENRWDKLCKVSKLDRCEDKQLEGVRQKRSQEFSALIGLSAGSKAVLINAHGQVQSLDGI